MSGGRDTSERVPRRFRERLVKRAEPVAVERVIIAEQRGATLYREGTYLGCLCPFGCQYVHEPCEFEDHPEVKQ